MAMRPHHDNRYKSFLAQDKALHLAEEAQNIVFVMAAIAALTPHPLGKPVTVRATMAHFTQACRDEMKIKVNPDGTPRMCPPQ